MNAPFALAGATPCNPLFEHTADFSSDDAVTLAGFTMYGPGLGKAVRERFTVLAADVLWKYGPRAFEMPKRAAAVHEAGHVVINSVLGVQTTSVSIDHVARNGKLLWVGIANAPELALVDTPTAPASFDKILVRARTVYAGFAAEILFAGEDWRAGSSLDEVMMSQILVDHAAALVGIEAERTWINEVAAWCRTQLLHNREAHAEITAALMERKRIKGKTLRDLCAKVAPFSTDSASNNATRACGNRWARAGGEIIVVTPRNGGDMVGALRE